MVLLIDHCEYRQMWVAAAIRQASIASATSTMPYGLSTPSVIHSSDSRAKAIVSYGLFSPRSYRHPMVMSGNTARAE
jgi:hypothetical protein